MANYQLILVSVAQPHQAHGSAISTEAIRPGHIIENVAAGTCKKNTRVVSGAVPRRIALHNAEEGKTVDDVWASGSRVKYKDCLPGDLVQVVLKAGSTAVVEELLRADATGCVLDSGATAPYCHALEALDLSGSGAVDTLILVRLL